MVRSCTRKRKQQRLYQSMISLALLLTTTTTTTLSFLPRSASSFQFLGRGVPSNMVTTRKRSAAAAAIASVLATAASGTNNHGRRVDLSDEYIPTTTTSTVNKTNVISSTKTKKSTKRTTKKNTTSIVGSSSIDLATIPQPVIAPSVSGEEFSKNKRQKRSVSEKTAPPATITSKDNDDGNEVQQPKYLNGRRILFSLNDLPDSIRSKKNTKDMDNNNEPNLVIGKLLSRPSKYNRSPYVADVYLLKEQREIIAHVPNLDMGGKCVPGALLLLKAARDSKTGQKVQPGTMSPKYNTPKCEYITQLLYVNDSERVQQPTKLNDNKKKNGNHPQSLPDADMDSSDITKNKNTNVELSMEDIRSMYPPVWVGAHPALGERIAEIWLQQNLFPLEFFSSPIVSVQKQIMNPCGTNNIRSDFCVTHEDGTKRIIEVKTVVDTDYSSYALPVVSVPTPLLSTTKNVNVKRILDHNEDCDSTKNINEKKVDGRPPSGRQTKSTNGTKKKKEKPQCIFQSSTIPYQRTAIFPWGTSNQKGPENEPVVSTRAIHHVRELTRIATGELLGENQTPYKATILFVIIRSDAEYFRPNHEACPSFCRYLKDAQNAGVQIIAKRVAWGMNVNEHKNNKNVHDEKEQESFLCTTTTAPKHLGTQEINQQQGICFDDKVIPVIWPEGYE